MKYSYQYKSCVRSGLLLLTLQLAGNSVAACDSNKVTWIENSNSVSEHGISIPMRNQVEAMLKLYEEFGDEIVWLMEKKLGTGSAEERFAVLQVFCQKKVFALIDQVIYSTTDSSRLRITPGYSTKISEYAERALVSMARQIGLWKEDYRKLYLNGSVDNWKALFWDFQRNFVVSVTTDDHNRSNR